jgi:hypothetical protein
MWVDSVNYYCVKALGFTWQAYEIILAADLENLIMK